MAQVIGYLCDGSDTASLAFGIEVMKHLDRSGNAVMMIAGKMYDSALNKAGKPATKDAFGDIYGQVEKVSAGMRKIYGGSRTEYYYDTFAISTTISEHLEDGTDVFFVMPRYGRDETTESLLNMLSFFNAGVGTVVSREKTMESTNKTYHLTGYTPTVVRACIGFTLPIAAKNYMNFVNYTHEQGVGEWLTMVKDTSRHSWCTPALIDLLADRERFYKGLDKALDRKNTDFEKAKADHSAEMSKMLDIMDKAENDGKDYTRKFVAKLTGGAAVTAGASAAGLFLFGSGPALGLIFYGLIAFAVTSGITSLILGVTGKKRKSVEAVPTVPVIAATPSEDWTEKWDELFARHHKVVKDWLEYELDLALSLTYPLMLDSSVAETAALHRAVVRAGDMKMTADASVNPVDTKYYDAVQDLMVAYKVAEDNARKVGQTIWTTEERKKVTTGKQLLNIAQNDGASTDERSTAYKQAVRTLEGVFALPAKGEQKLVASIGLIEQ